MDPLNASLIANLALARPRPRGDDPLDRPEWRDLERVVALLARLSRLARRAPGRPRPAPLLRPAR